MFVVVKLKKENTWKYISNVNVCVFLGTERVLNKFKIR